MARPKTENPRDKVVKCRLTSEEHAQLVSYADANKKTMSQVIVEALELIYRSKSK